MTDFSTFVSKHIDGIANSQPLILRQNVARALGENISVFDPRITELSYIQAQVLIQIAFPKEDDHVRSDLVDETAHWRGLADEYEFGEMDFEEERDPELPPDDLFDSY